MQKRKIKNYQKFSAIFSIILGTILHFTYKLSGENPFVAIFSAVNESVWEHLKLVFFPMLLNTIIGYYYIGKKTPNFWCAKSWGVIISIAFIVTFFYTYTGIIGKNFPIIDITSFLVAIILGEYISYKLIKNKLKCNNSCSIFFLIILLTCFIIFTNITPEIGIFKDPLTEKYGII